MTIDFMPGLAPSDAPTAPSTGVPAGTPDADPGSFAALLDRAAREAGEEQPPADPESEDETVTDDWATIVVPVPFVAPVVPLETIPLESDPAGAIDATGEATVTADGLPLDEDSDHASAPVAADAAALPAGVVPQTQLPGEHVAPADASQAVAAPVPAPDAAVEPAAARESAPEKGAAAPESAVAPGAAVPDEPTVEALPGERSDMTVTAAPEAATAVEQTNAQPGAGREPITKRAHARESQVSADPAPTIDAKAITNAAAAPEQDAEQPGSPETEVRQGDTVATAKGVAARLARALERAAEQVAAPAGDIAADQNGQAAPQDGDGQQASGGWTREQPTPPVSAVPRAQGILPATFSITLPPQAAAHAVDVLASAAATAATAGPALPADHDVTTQLLQSLRVQFRDGIGEAVLTLKPEQLGSVSISLRVENGGLRANVHADVPAVRQWIESQQDTLRGALAEHGLRLDSLVVDADGQRQGSPNDPEKESASRRGRSRRSVKQDHPAFEVVA